MKKFIFSVILFSGTYVTFAQDNHDNNRDQRPPSNVQNRFRKDYPDAKETQWQQNNGQWNANFKDNRHDGNVKTYYDKNGRRVDTHIPWQQSAIPVPVTKRVNTRYHSDYSNTERIERPGQKPVYKLHVKEHDKDRTIYMDENGHEKRYNDTHR